MTSEQIDALLAQPNHAIVGVNRATGAPQLTVVWYVWDGTSFAFSTKRDRAKYRNLKRDPSLSLLVDDREGGWYVVAYGRAEIVEQNRADIERQIVEKYVPEEQREQSLKELGNDPDRVIVVLHPDKILTGS